MADRKGFALILAAPSGAGKSTLARRLIREMPGVRLSVSTTTRAPRPGEVEGRDYFFTGLDDFRRRIDQGDFLEWAEVFGNRYGTSRSFVESVLEAGEDLLLDIDWQGARQMRAQLGAQRVVGVFILPPAIEVLQQRLVARGQDAPEVIAGRMDKARREIDHAGEFEYLLVNDDLEEAYDGLVAIVRAERLRGQRASGVLSRWNIRDS